MKHTEGPWTYRKQSSFNGYYIESEKGDFIGETGGGTMYDEEMLANTKLITAAPKMLKALQAARAVFQAQGINESNSIVSEQYREIIKAIKKATI